MKKILKKIEIKGQSVWNKIQDVMQDRAGENYVDVGVKILIAVVIGALLLAGLYALLEMSLCQRWSSVSQRCSITQADDTHDHLGSKGCRLVCTAHYNILSRYKNPADTGYL